MQTIKLSTTQVEALFQSAQALRRWCTPETVLVITNLLNEDALLFHIAKETQLDKAKIILIQAEYPSSPSSPNRFGNPHNGRGSLSFRFSQLVLARMASKLRWGGFNCEAILNKSFSLPNIRALVQSRAVDRIIIAKHDGQTESDLHWSLFTDHLLRAAEVPICIISSSRTRNSGAEPRLGKTLLALPLDSNTELPLAFAWRFAQEHQYHLTVMHVYSKEEKKAEQQDLSASRLAAHLPASTLREAELFCPLDISFSEGDPASEILKFEAETGQNFIILCSAGSSRPSSAETNSVAQRIVREALCPVIVLGKSARASIPESMRAQPEPKAARPSAGYQVSVNPSAKTCS